jgi:uncharacterized alpha-E superfamily protein
MLSRVAEAFFWIGRYLERAEGTARILEVVMQQTTGQAGEPARAAAARLLVVMGLPAQPRADLGAVVQLLAYDTSSRSSITGALVAARENARGVRHLLPAEVWEVLNVTYVELGRRGRSKSVAGLHRFLALVRTQTAAISGLTWTTMSRDDDWLFLTLGRALERTDVITRQLAASDIRSWGEPGLAAVLLSCGGYEPYLRRTHGIVHPARVANFLLRDPGFPRSAFASLTVAGSCLGDLAHGRRGPRQEPWRLLGRARADLEFATPGELLDDLPARLVRLQAACSQISDAVTRHYFSYELPTQWRTGLPG